MKEYRLPSKRSLIVCEMFCDADAVKEASSCPFSDVPSSDTVNVMSGIFPRQISTLSMPLESGNVQLKTISPGLVPVLIVLSTTFECAGK